MLISTFVKEIQIQRCTNTPLCTYTEATVHIYKFVGNLETVSDGHILYSISTHILHKNVSIHAHAPGCKDMNVRVLPPMNSSRGQTMCGGLGVHFLQMALSIPILNIIPPPCSVVMAYKQETLQDVILSPYITGR